LLSQCRRFGTCDPAASVKTSADYTVVSAWAVTPDHDLIWLDCVRQRLEVPDIVPAIEKLYAQNADESDLYNRLVNEHGGGNYRFEIRYNKGFTGLSWKETLADSPEWIERHRREAETSELEKVKTELEKLKAEREVKTTDNSSEFAKLQVEIAKMQGENQLAIAQMKHSFELEKVKAEAEKGKAAETPLALLQVASKSNNSELIKVAKDLIFDQKKGFADYAFETLDNPERLETITNVGIKIATAALGFFFPGKVPPVGTTAPKGENKSAVEAYKERLAKKKASEAGNNATGSETPSSNSKPKKEKTK
jgi:TolA-binding protein